MNPQNAAVLLAIALVLAFGAFAVAVLALRRVQAILDRDKQQRRTDAEAEQRWKEYLEDPEYWDQADWWKRGGKRDDDSSNGDSPSPDGGR